MPTRPPSVWCLFNLTLHHILNLVGRPDKPPNIPLKHPALLRSLRDTPRKRPKQVATAIGFRIS